MIGPMTHPRKTLREPRDLAALGLIPAERLAEIEAVARRYAVAITPAVLDRITGPEASAAVAAQFLPDAAELDSAPEEMADPIGDQRFSPVPGIVHRYPDRVLLKAAHVCPVYCRFCFRRETVGPDGDSLTDAQRTAALDYIRRTPEVWEVILTGGDPLVLSPRRLKDMVGALDAIDHVGVVRIHTRMPVAAPERVTAELVAALRHDTAVYVVLHANHPDEITREVRQACARLIDAGLPMLSQTVLLRGINDDAGTLTRLLRTLVAARIKPYYLHHLDPAPGTARFRTTVATGQALVAALRGTVSGLCQPTYVLDIPGGHGKVPIGPNHIEPAADGGHTVTDPQGNRHRYPFP